MNVVSEEPVHAESRAAIAESQSRVNLCRYIKGFWSHWIRLSRITN
jgi:hypothetical protein